MRIARRIRHGVLVAVVSVGLAALPGNTGSAVAATGPVEEGPQEVEVSTDVLPNPVLPHVEPCEAGQYTKNRRVTALRSQWRGFTVDNRGNPHPQKDVVSIRSATTRSHTWAVEGSVSTSIKAGLKLVAEEKIDATFGASFSATTSVTTEIQINYERTYPANTYSRWSYGVMGARVTADVYYISRSCTTRYVGSVNTYWPSFDGWWWTKLA